MSTLSKSTVLQMTHLRLKIKRYLVFTCYTEYINNKIDEFENCITKTRKLHVFYKRTLQLARLHIVTFIDVYTYYVTFMKQNIRYNLFLNVDVLIIENQTFCYKINEIFKQKLKEKKKHERNIQPYMHR